MMFLVLSNNKIDISNEEFAKIFCKVQINSFDITDSNGNEIGVALYKKFVYFLLLLIAFFHRSAKFDHSCNPNALITFFGKEIRVIACEEICDISKVVF